MKLSRLLFESIDTSLIALELSKPFKKSWPSSVVDALYSISESENPIEIGRDFYLQNKSIFDKILSGSKTFKYLASGGYGDAYDIGNSVLKIETEENQDEYSSTVRASKNLEILWGKAPLGQSVPMVYDKGEMEFNGKKFYWIVLEKFETVGRNNDLNEILDQIYTYKKSAKELREMVPEAISQLTSKFRLKQDWLEKLVADMQNLTKAGFQEDFHSENLGIRRVGGEGYFVVFD